MKRLKYLSLAALVAFAACDEGEQVVEPPPPAIGSIAGTVTAEGSGLQGVTVTISGPTSAQTTTGANGSYSFGSVEEGTYVVSIGSIPAGFVFTSTTTTVSITTDGETVPANFSGQVVRTASISGQVTADGDAVSGVGLTISGPEGDVTATTNNSGQYQVTGLRAGSYTVSITSNPDPDLYSFPNSTESVSLAVGQAATINFAGDADRPGEIRGAVVVDGSGMAGVTVTLAGDASDTAETDAQGQYSFTVDAGSYTVTATNPDPANIRFNTLTKSATVAEGETVAVNFVGQTIEAGVITGAVVVDNQGMAGVTVSLSGDAVDQTETGANGEYTFVVDAGTYTVTITNPDPADITFSTLTKGAVVAEGETEVLNFVGQTAQAPPEISIQSITFTNAMGNQVPVNLNNVFGQIEVTVNLERNGNDVNLIQVLIDDIVVAAQSIASSLKVEGDEMDNNGTETITLSVPTNQLRMSSNTWIPVVFNGAATISAQADEIPSNEVPVVINNPDAILLLDGMGSRPAMSPDAGAKSADDVGGTTWYTGSATYGEYTYLSYAGAGFEPTAVAFPEAAPAVCGAVTSTVSGSATAGILVSQNWACATGEGAVLPAVPGGTPAVTVPTLVGPDGSTVAPATGVSRLGAQFTLNGETRHFLLTSSAGLSAPSGLPIDNVAPAVTVNDGTGGDFVAFFDGFTEQWVKGDYPFVANDVTATDGGVDAGRTPLMRAFLYQGGPCDMSDRVTNPDGDDLGDGPGVVLAETVTSDGTPEGYQICGWAQDALMNAAFDGPSNFFGVDKVAARLRIWGHAGHALPALTSAPLGAAAGTTPVAPATDAVAPASHTDMTVYGDAFMTGTGTFHYSVPRDGTMMWGLEAIDDRAGLENFTTLPPLSLDLFPFGQGITHQDAAFPDPTSPRACATFGPVLMDPAPLPDNWRRIAAGWDMQCGNSQPGLFTYEGSVTDRAGNVREIGPYNWIEDSDNTAGPTANGITAAATTYTPATYGMFNLFAADNLEIMEKQVGIMYPTNSPTDGDHTLTLLELPTSVADDRWDDTFVSVLTGSDRDVMAFLHGRIDYTGSSGEVNGIPATDPGGPVAGRDFDAAANVNDSDGDGTAEDADLLPSGFLGRVTEDAGFNPQFGADVTGSFVRFEFGGWTSTVAEPWSAQDMQTFTFSGTPGGPFEAEHRASTSIDAPEFSGVYLILNDGGEVHICGEDTAPTFSDNGFNRFYTYIMGVGLGISPTPPICSSPPSGASWHAAGRLTGGAALLVTDQRVIVP